MQTFRQAWSGVAAVLIIDPTILPASNNVQNLPFEMLKEAFPAMDWNQPRGNRRAMHMTGRYQTPRFAEELAARVGCAADASTTIKWADFEIMYDLPMFFPQVKLLINVEAYHGE